MDKRETRKEALCLRDALNIEKRAEWSDSIRQHVLRYVQEKDIAVIAAYVSFRSEPETKKLISDLLEMGKIVCVPKCGKNGAMDMIPIQSLSDVRPGAYGIPEPEGIAISPEKIDLVLAPGCAFGKDMSRLGYGGGYYDRYLPGCLKALNVGLSFEAMIREQVPRETFDVLMDAVITEKGVMNKL